MFGWGENTGHKIFIHYFSIWNTMKFDNVVIGTVAMISLATFWLCNELGADTSK